MFCVYSAKPKSVIRLFVGSSRDAVCQVVITGETFLVEHSGNFAPFLGITRRVSLYQEKEGLV